ncbi:hypothetical protein VM1G_04450 [Cytospora mali]|uniref:Peptidase S26 domain-containing protein n=1 Tax=Cytospora mali TaxID=578113 RepID=A0A194VW65_CYTMA|nr:hypothetical protein VM1G_04450 [Valsa mali]
MAVGSAWMRFGGRASSFARDNIRYIFLSLTWAPVLLFIDKHVVGTTRIEGPSMYPYLNDRHNETRWGDVCLTWKLYAQENLQRGMIVTFHNPLKPESLTVKRIVGLPGDVVHTRPPFPNAFIRSLNHATSAQLDQPTDVSIWRRPHALHNMTIDEKDDHDEGRQPYLHSMIAGGLGGTTGDMLMHSLDTVKTRQQGDPHMPPKYTSLGSSYNTIFRQEGIRKGLYSGWFPALLGSFPGTVLFFGTYEYTKRHLIDYGMQPHIAYLTSGFLGDLAASIVYVPSEVLKTRLQLQGRYNNPYFSSGYNYRGTVDAARTIVRTEGYSALFHGYQATLFRDLPFSALQFMFYEQFQSWARQWKGSRDLGTPLEFLTGAAGGGLAGAMTCPLDVVKTRLQTQVQAPPPSHKTKTSIDPHITQATEATKQTEASKRHISTSSPSTHRPRRGAPTLQTSSVFTGLRMIYKHEGIGGWFRGVGPRFVWTSVQSGCMLLLYQTILRKLEVWMAPVEEKAF